MNTLTKTQVLALFLGTASAQFVKGTDEEYTYIKMLNGLSAQGTVPSDQDLKPASSGETCTDVGNALSGGCTKENEECGSFLVEGDAPGQNFCVDKSFCGWLGTKSGTSFLLKCWEAPQTSGPSVAPALSPGDENKPAAMVLAIANLITKVDQEPKLETVDDLLISSEYNYQDGWYILSEEGLWGETDKPADNRCYYDWACEDEETQCCALHPDTNNRRCIAKTAHGKEISVGPATFTPSCASQAPPPKQDDSDNQQDDDGAPTNAGDDIAGEALSEASEELKKFFQNQMEDAQGLAGYADMSDDDKAKWDEGYKAETDKRDELFKELKKMNGYDSKFKNAQDVEVETCLDDCKALIEAELLRWSKEVYETCKADPKSIECRQANEIKKTEEKNRANYDFYNLDADKQQEYTKGRNIEISRLESTLAAAWLADNAPEAGEDGGACLEGNKCNDANHCCGDAAPQTGKFVKKTLENVCASRTTLVYTNDLGEGYDHTCLAKNLAATAAAALAAAYALM